MSPRPVAPKTEAEPKVEDTAPADTEGADEKSAQILAGLNQLSELVLSQGAALQQIAKRVDRIENPNMPVDPADVPEPEPLPEGIARFWSKASDYIIFVEDEVTTEVDGELVIRKTKPRRATRSGKARALQFQHHILNIDLTEDGAQQLVDYLCAHPDYGVDFVLDPTARAQVTKHEVKAGIRGAAEQVAEKPPLTATF